MVDETRVGRQRSFRRGRALGCPARIDNNFRNHGLWGLRAIMSDPSWAISSKTEGRIEKGGKANNGRPDHRKESATTFQAWKTLQRAENLGNCKLRVDAKRSISGRGTITWQNLWKQTKDSESTPMEGTSHWIGSPPSRKITPEKWAAKRWIPLWIHHSHSSNARRQREREVSYSLIFFFFIDIGHSTLVLSERIRRAWPATRTTRDYRARNTALSSRE